MNFAVNQAVSSYLTPERIMIRDLARDFVRDVVLPTANRLDPEKGDIPANSLIRWENLAFSEFSSQKNLAVWGSVHSSTAWLQKNLPEVG